MKLVQSQIKKAFIFKYNKLGHMGASLKVFFNVMHLEYLSFECIKNVKSSN